MGSAIEWVRKANRRLKGCGLSLELRGKGDNLYMRGMFPAKDGNGSKQRSVALKMKALTLEDVRLAEQTARQVALDLNKGDFSWAKFSDVEEDDKQTIGYFVQELEQQRRHTVSSYTWQYAYAKLMQTLPLDRPISEDILYSWILERDPKNSTMRRKYVSIARALLDLAGLSDRKVSRLTSQISSKAINPRDLPEDEAILVMFERIKTESEEWAWTYGMLAVYGLRPHELFRLDLSNFPDVRVLPESKTGERIVPPLPPQWIDRMGLDSEIKIPSTLKWSPDDENWKLGRKIGKRYKKAGYGDPYNLRHCYARRCLVYGLTSDISSKLMGHSRQIHEDRYRAFIKGSLYVDIAKEIIAQRSIDKLPPN